MPARATSSGTISFGLVSIPVKIYPASRSKAVHFNMLHATDRSRLKQQYTCTSCGETVERSATVRGYEYAREQYVVLTEEELKALESKSDKSIEIEEFVPIDKVDPVYFEKAQLLGPDKGGQKAYRLLNEAMLTMARVAVGRHRTRGREQLVLIRPLGRGLVLHGLHYADEVASFEDVEFGDAVQLRANELGLAQQLIEQLASERFGPERYEDRYRQAVLAAVDQKIAGHDVVSAERAQEPEPIIDLMAALKRSIEARQGVAETTAAGRARRPALAKGKAKGSGSRRASR